MVIMLTVIVFGGMTVQMLEAALGIRMGVEDNKVSSSNKDDSRSAGAATRSAAGGQDTLTTIVASSCPSRCRDSGTPRLAPRASRVTRRCTVRPCLLRHVS